jgi:hypothetical protein
MEPVKRETTWKKVLGKKQTDFQMLHISVKCSEKPFFPTQNPIMQ